jgi:hypothetical protein
MVSDYFRAWADGATGTRSLEAYERELELTPTWVGVAAARAANDRLLASWTAAELRDRAPWLARESRVLGELSGALRELPGPLGTGPRPPGPA